MRPPPSRTDSTRAAGPAQPTQPGGPCTTNKYTIVIVVVIISTTALAAATRAGGGSQRLATKSLNHNPPRVTHTLVCLCACERSGYKNTLPAVVRRTRGGCAVGKKTSPAKGTQGRRGAKDGGRLKAVSLQIVGWSGAANRQDFTVWGGVGEPMHAVWW